MSHVRLFYKVPSVNSDYNKSLLNRAVLNGLKLELKRSVIQFAPQTVEAQVIQ